MKKHLLLLFMSIFVGYGSFSQEKFPPTEVITGTFIGKTIPLRDFPTMEAGVFINPDDHIMIPNESTTPYDYVETTTVIQNLQTEPGQIVTMPIQQNFIGASSSESGFFPPDPTGAVGPNHYVHSVNSLVKIFNKSGTLLVGPVSLASFLGIASNSGDPIVLYDQLADRWVVSEFGSLNNSLAIGVSETNDPTGAYNVYQYQFSGFPDYPKYGLWHDGYYGTVNLNGATTQGFVMERDVMLAGGPSPQIYIFNLPGVIINPNQVKSPEPVSLLGTTIDTSTPGYIVYLQDDGWTGSITFDHLKTWEIFVDWNNPSASSISSPLEIATDPFDAGELFGNGNGALRQPGTSQRLAAHGGIISFASYYRDFGTHNSWLITFNTFIDGNQTGGIRWIELRNDNTNPWSIFQEGTYSIADGHSRVMSSAAIDASGNIALAYTVGSTSLAPSLRYTGRFNGDQLGMMTVAETTIINGPGVRTNSNRYGDYSHMTMDPDNFTYWFTSDYFSSNNQWRTQVASFTLENNLASDVGVVNIVQPNTGILSNNESVQVTIRNFGTVAQSNFPLQLRLDGNLMATENFTGTINPGQTASFTFAQTLNLSTANQSYLIAARTNLTGDLFSANDSYNKEVSHLLGNDVGVDVITSPVSGSGLGTQTITAKLKNFGVNTQGPFNVQYTINGGTPVVETFNGSLNSLNTTNFSFATQADLNALGTYTITVSTLLAGDQEPSNNTAMVTVDNVLCLPSLDCSRGDGFQLVSIAEINNVSGCEGYGDFTSQIANLAPGSTNDITFTTCFGSQHVKVWIDFNDDFNFTSSELVVPNFIIASGQGAGSYTETRDLVIPANATLGEHRMRVKSNFNAPVPNDPCQITNFGETEDYTVNIGSLGVNDFKISNSDLIVTTIGDNQFEISLKTTFDSGVYLGVYNILGQEIAFNKALSKEGDTYKAKLNMSNVSSGVYILRVGGQTTTTYKTARIIVK